METVSADITLRPVRIGFLVNPRDRTSLSKVLRISNCLWGGMMSPLIPVMARIPLAWRDPVLPNPSARALSAGYLNFFQPDILIETRPGQLDLLGIDAKSHVFGRRHYRFEDLFLSEPGLDTRLAVGLSMHHVYRHLYQKEYQFQHREKRTVLKFSRGTKDGTAFFEAAYGMFPKKRELDYIPDTFGKAFAAEAASANFDTWRRIESGAAACPLFLTQYSIEERYSYQLGPSIFVFDPLSPEDVIDFWNFRLFVPEVVPVNVHWLAQSRDHLIEVIRNNHRPLPRNPNGIMVHTTVHLARSLDIDSAKEVLNLGGAGLPPHSVALQDWYHRIWNEWEDDTVYRPTPVVLNVKNTEAQVVPSTGETSTIRLPAISPEFAPRKGLGSPAWVNVIKLRIYGWNVKYAEALPSAKIDEYGAYVRLGFHDQYPSREGYVTFRDFAHDGSYITLPTMQQAIKAWLEDRQIAVGISDAGRVAEQLIASLGSVQGAGLVAEPEIITFFNDMARSRLVRNGGDAEEFPERTATIGQLQGLLGKLKKRPFGNVKTLDRFVEAGILRLGIAVSCVHCSKENWYSLDDVGSTIRCERCLKTFAFPQGRIPAKDYWKYRVVGPFATPHFAQGAYSVALTLAFLKREVGGLGDELTYATGLLLTHKRRQIEADFFAWHNRRGLYRNSSEPSTLLGECKSLGSEAFKVEDIDRLKELATLIPGSFLVASTLKDRMSDQEVRLLRKLAEWGWKRDDHGVRRGRLVVLTGIELFGRSRRLHNIWKDAGGHFAEIAEQHSHISNFEELAQASQQAHLGLSLQKIHEMKYGRKVKL
jgi:hypothetical protein